MGDFWNETEEVLRSQRERQKDIQTPMRGMDKDFRQYEPVDKERIVFLKESNNKRKIRTEERK
jgi:hypothetical protein